MTWITHVCGVSAEEEKKAEDYFGSRAVPTKENCCWFNLTEPGGVLTCFCEPGGGRVGIDCAKSDHLAEFSSFTDCDTDERVGLFGDHQHFKDLQRTG